MRIAKDSPLFSIMKGGVIGGEQQEGKIVPYIEKFLTVHPYAGIYEVDDRKYISSESDPEKKHFHPSGDCMKCQRLMYYERCNSDQLEQEVFSPKTQAIFKVGSALHAMIQAWFKEMSTLNGFPALIANEMRIDDEKWNIGGFIDSVVQFPGTIEHIPIEIKTINSYKFSNLSAPLPAHRLQVGCYIMELEAPYGIVLYINKDTCEWKEFRVEPMDMQNVLFKWSEVRQTVLEHDPSSLPYSCEAGSREWERCPARFICRGGNLSPDFTQ